MLVIGICDDEKMVLIEMQKYIELYAKQRELEYRLIYYSSGQELLMSYMDDQLNLLFLDMEMPEMDGIQTAEYLNKGGFECKIVMLTNHTERFKEAFKIGAFRFVSKPVDEVELFEAIDDVRSRIVGDMEEIVFRDGKAYTIQQKDILYLTTCNDGTCIYTKNFDFHSDKSLAWWEQKLDDRMFFRSHKAYIVNIGKISKFEKDILLQTGEKILVSRRKRKGLEQKFMEYDLQFR